MFHVSVELQHNLIIVGQQKGTVTLIQLSTCEVLGVLNKGYHQLPAELMPQPESPDKCGEKKKVNRLEAAATLAKKVRDFKRDKTKRADWHSQLATSKDRGTFSSNVFGSIQKINSLAHSALPSNTNKLLPTRGAYSSRPDVKDSSVVISSRAAEGYQTI